MVQPVVATTNGNSMDVDHPETNGVAKLPAPKYASGLILPPPELKSVIDRISLAVSRSTNPVQFEDRLRETQRSDPKFSFLNSSDPYHAYYRHQLEVIAAGAPDGPSVSGETPSPALPMGETAAPLDEDIGKEPPPHEFTLDLPSISPVDLDIMKLTALFTARRGRTFLAALSRGQGQNYQFDFLSPTHSLFGHFNRLVEQYTKVLMPSKKMLERVEEGSKEGARWSVLENVRQYAKWEKRRREHERRRKDDQEAERIAFAEIDWYDYAIVQTIEFTAADGNTELPPPMSKAEVESMTLAQKRMAAMIMEDAAEEVETHRAQQAADAATAAMTGAQDATMEQSDSDDDEVITRRAREEDERQERAQNIQASSLNAGGPMKIRTDYVPKLGAKGNKAMTTCMVCRQQVPVDELQEHMRIELLDPKWKSQRDAIEARKAQAHELQQGANVVASLKGLASARVDIFGAEEDEERRKKAEEEERLKRKEREKVVWDGHTASKANTLDKFSNNVNFDEQIAAIHRAKGLGPQDPTAIGPGIGPASAPPPVASSLPPAPASLPPPPHQGATSSDPAYAAATVSAGPQPASSISNGPAPVMLPPLHYQGLNAAQPFGYQPPPTAPVPSGPPPGMHPSRMAALQASPPAASSPTGQVRTASEMEGDGDDSVPPAKRQKMSVMPLPGGQLYPEEDWINLHPHPITLHIQTPNDASTPEWKLDGSVVVLQDLTLSLLVSTLRDRFLQTTGSTLGAARMRLSHHGKMLTNKSSIASYNLEHDDVLLLSVSEQKKKR